MTCLEFQERVDVRLCDRRALQDRDRLAEILGASVADHAFECDACRRWLLDTAWLHQTVGSLPKTLPTLDLASAVWKRLNSIDSPSPGSVEWKTPASTAGKSVGTPWWGIVSLAASVCFCALTIRHAGRRVAAMPETIVPSIAATASAKTPKDPGRDAGFSLWARSLAVAAPEVSKVVGGPPGTSIALPEIDFAGELGSRALSSAPIARQLQAASRPIADSAGKAFAFLWMEPATGMPNPN